MFGAGLCGFCLLCCSAANSEFITSFVCQLVWSWMFALSRKLFLDLLYSYFSVSNIYLFEERVNLKTLKGLYLKISLI